MSIALNELRVQNSIASGEKLIVAGSTAEVQIDYDVLARAIVEQWSGSTLAGSSQSVKSAIDAAQTTSESLNTSIATLQNQVGSLANGSPTPVETIAEMTDESAVYLYTGSETGYTAGNWYFWNGSAWTSGGTYGGAVTDTTLSISGAPADAKAVGDALALKADDTDVTALDTRVTATESELRGSTITGALTFEITADEWVNSSGEIVSANGWSRSGYISIGDIVSITPDKAIRIALFDSSNTFLRVREELTANTAYTFNTPYASKFILFGATATINSASVATVQKTRIAVLESATSANSAGIATIKTDVAVSPSSIVDDTFITKTGAIHTSDGWACTGYLKLPYDNVSSFKIRGTFQGIAGCAIYNKDKEVIAGIDGNNVTDYGGTSKADLQEISVPHQTGMRYIRISAKEDKFSALTEIYVKGNALSGAFERIFDVEEDVREISANVSTSIAQSKVLVIGDSISADAYGGYTKWVSVLMNEGFLPADTVNSSQHATGFVARYNNQANDFITRLETIQNPSQYDLVIVFGGINDYIQNIPMGSESGTDYTVSFKPAVNEFFSYLIENFTQARICVLLPLRTKATWKNSANEYEWSYSEYIHTVAKSYCLPVLNLTEESGFCPYITTFSNMWTLQPEGYTGHDGVHPTEDYERKYLAPMIKHFLQGML